MKRMNSVAHHFPAAPLGLVVPPPDVQLLQQLIVLLLPDVQLLQLLIVLLLPVLSVQLLLPVLLVQLRQPSSLLFPC